MAIAYNSYMRKREYQLRDDLNPFLRKINSILIERNLTATNLSTMAGLGSSTLSNLIKRNNVPTFSTLEKICTVLGIRMSEFIRDIEEWHPELFIDARSGIQRYDPLHKQKQQIIEDWAALPVSDRDETLKYMLKAYIGPDETE